MKFIKPTILKLLVAILFSIACYLPYFMNTVLPLVTIEYAKRLMLSNPSDLLGQRNFNQEASLYISHHPEVYLEFFPEYGIGLLYGFVLGYFMFSVAEALYGKLTKPKKTSTKSSQR
jgi:hypothetical protein